jgi:uncharacterized protein YrzB (UPF0473 family)
MPKQIITVIDELSNKREVDLVSILSGTETNKLYIVFSDKIQGEANHVDLVIAEAHEKNNELAISPIRNEDELIYAKNLFYEAVGGFANV